jgi:SAM-dependent methyltransferase
MFENREKLATQLELSSKEEESDIVSNDYLLLESFALSRIESTLSQVLVDENAVGKKGMFPYVALGTQCFIEGLRIAIEILENRGLRRQDIKFIDIGCGIGTKLVFAQSEKIQVFGLEYNFQYCKFAKQVVLGLRPLSWRNNESVICADALTWPRFDAFDILYFYRPFADANKEMQLEKHVFQSMKVGSTIIRYGDVFPEDRWPGKFTKHDSMIWEKTHDV